VGDRATLSVVLLEFGHPEVWREYGIREAAKVSEAMGRLGS
jgi:hypothetical protein